MEVKAASCQTKPVHQEQTSGELDFYSLKFHSVLSLALSFLLLLGGLTMTPLLVSSSVCFAMLPRTRVTLQAAHSHAANWMPGKFLPSGQNLCVLMTIWC